MIRWPNEIPAGLVTDELVGMPDIYRTLLTLGGGKLPDHTVDGHDLTPFLAAQDKVSPRRMYPYFRGGQLQAYREGPWKLRLVEDEPQLFNLQNDPGERWNRAEEEPEIVDRMQQKMEEVAREFEVELPSK